MNIKHNIRSVVIVIIVGIVIATAILLRPKFFKWNTAVDNNWWGSGLSGQIEDSVNTWNTMSGDILSRQSIDLITNESFENKSSFSMNFYPKIQINKRPEDLTLVADIWFTTGFQNSEYAKSNWYGFALKFFIDSINNWGFYNVFRQTNGGFRWDQSRWLTWRVIWSEISDWHIRTIPLYKPVDIAVSFENVRVWYQYIPFDPSRYLKSNIWKPITIWVYLSSVKELPWWKFTYIKSLSIKYTWTTGDIVKL